MIKGLFLFYFLEYKAPPPPLLPLQASYLPTAASNVEVPYERYAIRAGGGSTRNPGKPQMTSSGEVTLVLFAPPGKVCAKNQHKFISSTHDLL